MQEDDKIGRYRIVTKIGEGGMGEVYLAEDTKLGRRVALKILQAKVAGDADRVLRFEHEAKSASALNHPNIITIYEINDEDEELFIAMEYVEGQTLAKKIKSREFDLRQTLDVAIQIAAALAAAHDANVIHRDIKPDNVIVRPDGLVKVLDFGLAKLTEKPSSYDFEALSTLFKTSPGLVIGTVGYMSPEQARGRIVDGRSDIFSFGSMLYEMLSGKRPFTGENEVDVVASIIHKEPEPLNEIVTNVPHDLLMLVRKTLRKNCEERYQTVRELLADLRDVRQELTDEVSVARTRDLEPAKDSGDMQALGVTTARGTGFATSTISKVILTEIRLHPIIAAAAIVLALLALTYAGAKVYRSGRPLEAFQTMRLAKLTSIGSVEGGQVAVSPDGKYIAYVVNETGRQSLWVKQASTSSNVQIVPAGDVRYNGLTFSPDGIFIYYSFAEKTGSPSIYQVPVLGGLSRKMIVDAGGPLAFSPDGGRISFVRWENEIMSSRPDGSDIESVAKLSDGKIVNRTSWSPDGETLAAAVFLPADSNDHLVEINVKTGAEKPFPSPDWLRLRGVAWLPDSSGVLVSGRDPDTQLSQIWFISYPDGTPRRVTNDLSNYQGLSLSADGRAAVSTQQVFLSNLWVIQLNDAKTAGRITSGVGIDEGLSGVALAPDGRIVYTTRIKGTQDLWIVNKDGSENRQLTFNARVNHSPAVSSDGRYVVFVSTRGGSPSIWRMNISGDDPVELTPGPGAKFAPSLSPDGNWVVYQNESDDRKATVRKVNISGGASAGLTDIRAARPVVSPDGQFVACEFGEAGPGSSARLAIISINGGQPLKLLDFPSVLASRIFRWSADGSSIIYSEGRDRVDNIWSQPLDGSPAKQLTDLKVDRIFRFDISPRGDELAIARGTDSSDAVMISNFR